MLLKTETANALIALSIIILLAGAMIGSPAGRLFAAVISGLIVLVPLLHGNLRRRIFAGIVLAVASTIALSGFGDYQQDAAHYRARASRQSQPHSATEPTRPGLKPSTRGEFASYRAEDCFTCVIPAGWSKEERLAGLAPGERNVCWVILHGPDYGALPIKIHVHYYAAGNLLYRSPEHYIALFSQPSLGMAGEGDQYGPVTDETDFACAAKTFERRKNEYRASPVLVPPEKEDGKVYERGEMMAVAFPVRERFVVAPAEDGFYALRYSAPAEHFIEFLDVFTRLKQSFQPLK